MGSEPLLFRKYGRSSAPCRDLARAKTKHAVISAFLLFHLVAITCWCIPVNSALIANFKDLIRPYMLWSGLFQGWDMFAPTPPNINSYIQAAVIYKDGRTQIWKFPRMEQLGLFERYYRERYRKFEENLRQDANSALWPDVARHIARLNNNDVSNPPAIVVLVDTGPRFRRPRQMFNIIRATCAGTSFLNTT